MVFRKIQNLYWVFCGLNANTPKFQLISLKYTPLKPIVIIVFLFFNVDIILFYLYEDMEYITKCITNIVLA